MNELLAKVYGLVGVGLLATGVVANTLVWTPTLVQFLALFVVMILMVVGTCVTTGPTSAGLFMGFSALQGALMAPTIQKFMAVSPSTVAGSALATAVVFVGLSLYTWWSDQSFSFMGGALFVSLWGLIALAIVSVFVPGLNFLVSALTVVLFSLYILYDTSNIKEGVYNGDQYGAAAMALYLDIINIFLSLLQMASSDD